MSRCFMLSLLDRVEYEEFDLDKLSDEDLIEKYWYLYDRKRHLASEIGRLRYYMKKHRDIVHLERDYVNLEFLGGSD